MIEAHPDEALHEAERHVRDDAPLVAASLRVLARGEHAVALSPAEVFGNTEAGDLSHLHHRKALGVVDRGIVADFLQREAVVRVLRVRSEEHTSELQSLMRNS